MTLTIKMNELFSPAGLASWVIWKVLVIKMDDTTVAMFRKSFKWVFDKGAPVLSHSLLLMEGWPQSGNLRKKREKSANLNSLFKRKSFTISYVQSDDLSFHQNACISKSQGNSSEVREKLGKMKVEKGATLDDGVSQFSFVVLSEINYNNEKVI